MIERKSVKVETLARRIVKDRNLLSEVIKGTESDWPKVKYKCGKALIIVSEKKPGILYPKWDSIVKLLNSENTFMKSIGIRIIANLTTVDKKDKFDTIFDRYYKLMNDESMITASNIVGNSGRIAKAKPHLQTRITNRLLKIDETHHSPECRNIIKGKAIISFGEYYEETKNKKKIMDFVKKETKNRRPATRKKAQQFLKKWED